MFAQPGPRLPAIGQATLLPRADALGELEGFMIGSRGHLDDALCARHLCRKQIVQRGASEDVYSHLHQSAVRKKHDSPGGDGSLRFEFQFNVLDITKLP